MSYESIIEDQGVEVLNSLYMGDYQGDILMIVRNKAGQFGVLTTGYGSCSGCDALEACYGFKEEEDNLARDLINSVIWHDPENIIEYLDNKDWEGSYYGQAQELSDFIKEIRKELMIRCLGGF